MPTMMIRRTVREVRDRCPLYLDAGACRSLLTTMAERISIPYVVTRPRPAAPPRPLVNINENTRRNTSARSARAPRPAPEPIVSATKKSVREANAITTRREKKTSNQQPKNNTDQGVQELCRAGTRRAAHARRYARTWPGEISEGWLASCHANPFAAPPCGGNRPWPLVPVNFCYFDARTAAAQILSSCLWRVRPAGRPAEIIRGRKGMGALWIGTGLATWR
jgi:hypothetical protein